RVLLLERSNVGRMDDRDVRKAAQHGSGADRFVVGMRHDHGNRPRDAARPIGSAEFVENLRHDVGGRYTTFISLLSNPYGRDSHDVGDWIAVPPDGGSCRSASPR